MGTPIPANDARFTLREIADTTLGRRIGEGDPPLTGVSTDTRAIRPGSLFVALRGESFDGHDFVGKAVSAGAAALLVSNEGAVPPGFPAVVVHDPQAALGALGAEMRRRWGASPHPAGPRRIVAIAGSAGKTTTTRCIAEVLSAARPGEVLATAGNLNNAVGLPMMLMLLKPEHRFAVLEVGTSIRGEVAALAAVVRPEVGVVTRIGLEHNEGIGGLADVAAEEGDLFRALPADGVAVGNADDPLVAEQLLTARARRVTYGTAAGATLRIASRRAAGLAGSEVVLVRPDAPELRLPVPLLGAAGALALAAAVAASEALLGEPVSADAAQLACERLREFRMGRLEPVELPDGTVVIDDSYNSNPTSLESSIGVALELATALSRRLVLVLGEMRELGGESAASHDLAGSWAAAAAPAGLVAVAGDARLLAERARASGCAATFVETAEEAAAQCGTSVLPGDVVLVKGSRGVALEKVVRALRIRSAA